MTSVGQLSSTLVVFSFCRRRYGLDCLPVCRPDPPPFRVRVSTIEFASTQWLAIAHQVALPTSRVNIFTARMRQSEFPAVRIDDVIIARRLGYTFHDDDVVDYPFARCNCL